MDKNIEHKLQQKHKAMTVKQLIKAQGFKLRKNPFRGLAVDTKLAKDGGRAPRLIITKCK